VISGILGRSTHIRDDSVCLHINEYDPSNRAHFYINSLLNAGNIDYPFDRAYIGGFDKHIEHHLFPFLSSRKLDEASERVRALCEKYDLPYKEGSLGRIMLEAIKLDLKTLFAA
jgi:linoleoyl-CoA desaturase